MSKSFQELCFQPFLYPQRHAWKLYIAVLSKLTSGSNMWVVTVKSSEGGQRGGRGGGCPQMRLHSNRLWSIFIARR